MGWSRSRAKPSCRATRSQARSGWRIRSSGTSPHRSPRATAPRSLSRSRTRRNPSREPEPEPAPEPELAPEPEAGAPEPPAPSESLEDLIAEEEPFPEDTGPQVAEPEELPLDPEAPPAPAPEQAEQPPEPTPEPESSVPEPPPPPPETGPEPPGRARGRVDVPTQEHPPPADTGGLPPAPSSEPGAIESGDEPAPRDESAGHEEPLSEEEPAVGSGGPALYDFETDEDPLGAPAEDDDFEALGPAEEEAPYIEDEEAYAEEPESGTEPAPDEPGTAVRPVLEDEEVYEGGSLDPEESYDEEEGEEGLWFEKGPPKDFDFD